MKRLNRVASLIAAAVLIGCGDTPEYSFAERVCDACQLELTSAARIAPERPHARFLIHTALAVSADGRFFAAPLVDRARVAAFSPGGDHPRTFGALGSGPGEMAEIEGLTVGRGDSVFVMDRARMSVFTAAGEFVRAIEVGATATVHEAPSGDLIVADGFLGGGIRRVGRDGTVPVDIAPSSQERESRVVRIGQDGRIWSLNSAYHLEVYSQEGELLDSADLSAFLGAPDERYSVRVTDLSLSEDGLLMVLVGRRDGEWRRPRQGGGGEGAPVMLSVFEATELNDYYLDVVDPERERLLARRKLEGMFVRGFLATGQLYTVESDEHHELSLRTWDVAFAHARQTASGREVVANARPQASL